MKIVIHATAVCIFVIPALELCAQDSTAKEQGPGSSALLTVKVQQTRVMLYEPLFLTIELSAWTGQTGQPDLSLHIDDALVVPKRTEWLVSESKETDGAISYTVRAIVFRNAKGFIIDKPGAYKLIAKEAIKGVSSKACVVEVGAPGANEREVSEAFRDSFDMSKSAEARKVELQNATKEGERSSIVKYAAYHLLLLELEGRPVLKSNAPHEKDKVREFYSNLLTKYDHLVRDLPKPTAWHCGAAFTIARSKAWNYDYRAALADLRELEREYSEFPQLAKSIRMEIVVLERESLQKDE